MKKTNIRRRWKQYAAAAAGVVGTAVGLEPEQADATILYTDAGDLTITHGSYILFDLDRSGPSPYVSTSYYAVAGRDFAPLPSGAYYGYAPNYTYMFHVNAAAGNAGAITGGVKGRLSMLSAGAAIGPASTWDTGYFSYFDVNNDPSYPWVDGGTAFVGLRLDTGAIARYGWARITYDGTDIVTLHDFAVQLTPETAILAGAGAPILPEPSSLAIWGALGAAGLLDHRRRRRNQQRAEGEPASAT